MLRKKLWCYVFVLTLLDLSLNSKLTAQGESHDSTIHDPLVEGITFQDWGQEPAGGEGARPDGVALEPAALRFGRAALAAPHARTVTLTNTANTTLHLASVAGTTPDFHASFFESKTLPPQANTTFSVVYLGRAEGPVAAHLYIHTSLGVHKYPVSAVGVASAYELWPLVGLRVPHNASVEPELTLYNPTDEPVQVSEVYSTGAWLGLRLPGGAPRAPRDAWAVPPRTSRPLVTLRVAPHGTQPLTAYVRIKANVPGGGLLVAVEARAAPPGEHARPLQLRLRARGSGDAAYTVELELANSGGDEVPLEASVRGAGCWRTAPPPSCAAPAAAGDAVRANGGTSPGAHLTPLRTHLAPHQGFVRVARLTLDFGELWAAAAAGAAAGAGEAWCAGCVRLGRAHVPYGVRLVPGALRFSPPELDVVTAGEDALRERELSAHNEFAQPLRVLAVELPARLAEYFHVVDRSPLTLAAGARAALAHLRLRARVLPADVALDAALTVHTERARYRVPLRLYSGRLLFEWQWPNATDAELELGTVGASATLRVPVRLRNPAPARLCLAALAVSLPGAAASFARAAPHQNCLEGGERAQAWLTVVAPGREGALRGLLQLDSTLAGTGAALALRVRHGRVRALPLRLPPAAPFAGAAADLQAESSMAARMRVTRVEPPPARRDDALAVTWEGAGYGRLGPGTARAARVRLRPERRCLPRCYTGLPLASAEGAAWLRRGEAYDAAALRDDLELLRARLALFDRQRAAVDSNFTLLVHTTEVLHVEAAGTMSLWWPRLAGAGAGRAALAGVRRSSALRLAVRSPAHVPLLLQALLTAEAPPPDLPARAGGDSDFCSAARCSWSRDAFRLDGWRVTRGAARPWNDTGAGAAAGPGAALPPLLLEPHSELELSVLFSPQDAGSFTTYLYLRNNLTVLEGVRLFGEGEHPRFELAGRAPGSQTPFLFEVKECAWGGPAGAAQRVLARNTGRVRVSLTDWAVAGAEGACAARGFRVRPCAPLHLEPNATAPLLLAFAPDYTLARAAAALRLHSDLGPAEYLMVATVPAKLLAECAASAPRPPWENVLRSGGVAFALLALALVLAAAPLDAERLLRRARASRSPLAAEAPLDLRALAAPAAPPAPSRVTARRRRPPRRAAPPLDPAAERRAFERWRAEVLRRDADSSRSSDDEPPDEPPRPEPAAESPPGGDDAESSGSDDSTPADEPDDAEDADEPYGGDVEPDPRDDSPAGGSDAVPTAVLARSPSRTPPPDVAARGTRAPPDSAEVARRAERLRGEAERRAAHVRHHARKERAAKRRGERPATPPPPPSAPATPAAAEAPEARGGVRWGASWSSVVAARGAAGPSLAPIGSDVRRREPERAPDNSLFYFNGTTVDAARPEDFPWRTAVPPGPTLPSVPPGPLLPSVPPGPLLPSVPPGPLLPSVPPGPLLPSVPPGPLLPSVPPGPLLPPERQSFVPSARDFLEEARALGGAPAWDAWGAAGAWGALRPPPGFAGAAPRPYDPFRSLASIWAPAPHDWRAPPERDERDARDTRDARDERD